MFRDSRNRRQRTSLLDLIHHEGRAVEWLTSWAGVLFSVALLSPGDNLATSPNYQGFVELGLTDTTLGLSALVMSSLRLVALYRNGTWHSSPVLRLLGACFGCMFFSCIGVAFQLPYLRGEVDAPSTALVYFAIACGDLVVCGRAGSDASRNRR